MVSKILTYSSAREIFIFSQNLELKTILRIHFCKCWLDGWKYLSQWENHCPPLSIFHVPTPFCFLYQASLKLTVTHLALPPEDWDEMRAPRPAPPQPGDSFISSVCVLTKIWFKRAMDWPWEDGITPGARILPCSLVAGRFGREHAGEAETRTGKEVSWAKNA